MQNVLIIKKNKNMRRITDLKNAKIMQIINEAYKSQECYYYFHTLKTFQDIFIYFCTINKCGIELGHDTK